ncbi:hypothetical protein KM043_005749 [Ampulex compressa]|nr:hypothetical protein KM043_005749 [Ampulex compressa]
MESCRVTVEPLSQQQVGLLGTQRGWPPGKIDTSNNAENRSGSLPVLSSFFLPTSPCRSSHYYEQLLMADGLSAGRERSRGPEVRNCRVLPVSLDASRNLLPRLLLSDTTRRGAASRRSLGRKRIAKPI